MMHIYLKIILSKYLDIVEYDHLVILVKAINQEAIKVVGYS